MTTLALGGILILFGGLGIAITLALQPAGPGIAGCSGANCSGDQGVGMTGSMDAMFIQEMIPHHDDAIAMADLALTRAEHPELRELAETIKQTQTAENAQMRDWYREWFDAAVPEGSVGMMGGMMGSEMTDLAALTEAGSFDREFIEQMVPHHEMAIMMSQMAGGPSARPEMREFTQGIIDTQSAEIELMLDWYAEWYGR